MSYLSVAPCPQIFIETIFKPAWAISEKRTVQFLRRNANVDLPGAINHRRMKTTRRKEGRPLAHRVRFIRGRVPAVPVDIRVACVNPVGS